MVGNTLRGVGAGLSMTKSPGGVTISLDRAWMGGKKGGEYSSPLELELNHDEQKNLILKVKNKFFSIEWKKEIDGEKMYHYPEEEDGITISGSSYICIEYDHAAEDEDEKFKIVSKTEKPASYDNNDNGIMTKSYLILGYCKVIKKEEEESASISNFITCSYRMSRGFDGKNVFVDFYPYKHIPKDETN